MASTFTTSTLINVPVDFAFNWHKMPGGFERLAPPWETLRVVRKSGALEDGDELVFQVKLAPGIWKTWHARHFDYIEGKQFCDEQVSGPFSSWRHVHRFEAAEDNSCRIIDDVNYELPLEPFSDLGASWLVRKKVEAMFQYRCETVRRDLERHFTTNVKPKKIALTGATGMVGSNLTPFLLGGGHEVLPITRSAKGKQSKAVFWDPETGIPEAERGKLEGIDAVIHLAGENIFGLWTNEKKARIRDSRVRGTRRLCEALASLEKKPKVLVAASAIGFYGNRGDEVLSEESERGSGFLADVAEEWEAATEVASEAGIRVVNLRIGTVLSPKGGALGMTKLPFGLGLGGRLGSGDQWMSWISIDDLIYCIHEAIANNQLAGPINACSPFPVTNAEFTRAVARVLDRPAILPAPEFVLRGTGGELAEEILLSSARVHPEVLIKRGFKFQWRDLDSCLGHLLGKV